MASGVPVNKDVDAAPRPKQYERLVHIDLKGAPLKIDFLTKLIVKLKEWGATGLLVEYEDTFPYSRALAELALPNAYSLSDIAILQKVTRDIGMDYIPLVQTFGHLEFVLKHNKFVHFREVGEFPTAVCPSREDTLPLIQSLLEQVIQAHPNLKFLHIGADEVVHLGFCHKCQHRIEADFGGDHCLLYLDHVAKVLRYLKQRHPGITFIMWDDMLRGISSKNMNDVQLGGLVEPMVWNYTDSSSSFRIRFNPSMWHTYSQVFGHVWIASAFKGAFGTSLHWVPTKQHVSNHLLWLEELDKEVPKTLEVRGLALTGWQRYDHTSPLCELLPVALPCLALCLQVVIQGHYSDGVLAQVSEQLGFTKPFQMESPQHPDCLKTKDTFPSSDVFLDVQELVLFESSPKYKEFVVQNQLAGSTNPNASIVTDLPMGHHSVDENAAVANRLAKTLDVIRQRVRISMRGAYHSFTVEEWLEVRINHSLRALQMFVGGGSMDEVKEEDEEGS